MADLEPLRLTQTSLDPGNCWQTCVAMLLRCDPELLPDQTKYDLFRLREDGSRDWYGKSYQNVLQAFLLQHHGLAYCQLHAPSEVYAFLRVAPDPGFHMMTGLTVRSATNGHQRHVVVARHGELWHDPHPSCAGLLDDIDWAFLIPTPKAWADTWKKTALECECPACKKDS